jgi:hypothetical protein
LEPPRIKDLPTFAKGVDSFEKAFKAEEKKSGFGDGLDAARVAEMESFSTEFWDAARTVDKADVAEMGGPDGVARAQRLIDKVAQLDNDLDAHPEKKNELVSEEDAVKEELRQWYREAQGADDGEGGSTGSKVADAADGHVGTEAGTEAGSDSSVAAAPADGSGPSSDEEAKDAGTDVEGGGEAEGGSTDKRESNVADAADGHGGTTAGSADSVATAPKDESAPSPLSADHESVAEDAMWK